MGVGKASNRVFLLPWSNPSSSATLFCFLILALLNTTSLASEKAYKTGKLVDLGTKSDVGSASNVATGSTVVFNYDTYIVSVQLGGIIYSGEVRSKKARDLIVGDPVDVCVEGNTLYIKNSGGDIKAKIFRRARVEQ
jgi:hypothetical protein